MFFLLLIFLNFIPFAKAQNLKYLDGLYQNRNCQYFAVEVKKYYSQLPDDYKDNFLAKLADCSVERDQLEFAESIIKNLEKRDVKSTILQQAKARLFVQRNDFAEVIKDFTKNKPTKATFQYYLYVAQSYYEVENYDESLKVLSFISPLKLTTEQKNIIRYWKAKNYFLKDDIDKALTFLDYIDESEDESWVKEAAHTLLKSIRAKQKMHKLVVIANAAYDDNYYKQSSQNNISLAPNETSYIQNGVYRINPIYEGYLVKNPTTKKFIGLELNWVWPSLIFQNQTETTTLKYRESHRTDNKTTLTWDIGLTKTQLSYVDYSDEVFIKLGAFHLIQNNIFSTFNFKYAKGTDDSSKSNNSQSLTLFYIMEAKMLYATLAKSQVFAESAQYSLSGFTTPVARSGIPFSNYDALTVDLTFSYEINDEHSIRTSATIGQVKYQKEDIPPAAASLTNSTDQRIDQTLTGTLVYTTKLDESSNLEFSYSHTEGSSEGHQGFLGSSFSHKNYINNIYAINYDWTFE